MISATDRTPLMLNTVLGFTAEQVARRYAVPNRTMATRLVRAKRRIRDHRIPFRLPDRSHVRDRMDAVLAAVYAAYVIDWSTGPGERDLPPEALHLAEVLAKLVPDDPEVRGLAALVELSAVRRPARLSSEGPFVPLASQDTTAWDEVSSPGRTSTSAPRTTRTSSGGTSSRPPSRPCTAPAGRPGARTGPPCSTCTVPSPSWHRAWAARLRSPR